MERIDSMRKLLCELLGVVSKKELKERMEKIRQNNRASKLGQTYEGNISEKQRDRNIYLQGYEDGTDNICNAIYSIFDLNDLK